MDINIHANLALSKEQLQELNSGQCTPQRLMELVLSECCSIIGVTFESDVEPKHWHVPCFSAGKFFVQTPDGTLAVTKIGDEGYPGVLVELMGENPVALSLTEYIPGGEALCGYDPEHPEKDSAERAEVPVERRQMGSDGREECSAGFVTRAWPNDRADEEYHIRVFHTGYKEES